MVIYETEVKVKEIGIRKILGASVPNIIFEISKSFVFLLVLASVLAAPVAWHINQMILRYTVNRIPFGAGIFVLGFSFMMGLGLVVIFSQTVKAARGNPVEALRYE